MATTLTWNSEWGAVSRDPALEDATRAAIIAACDLRMRITVDPVFDGSHVIVARNAEAADLEAACVAGLPADLDKIARNTILTLAVACAELYKKAGGNAEAWALVGAELVRSRKRIAGR